MKPDPKKTCLRCGACCKTSFFAYVSAADLEKWHDDGRKDVLEFFEKASPMWAGDRLISNRTGRKLKNCPFFKWKGKHGECGIYAARPGVCREYDPGDNEMCPQFSKLEFGD